MVNSGHKRPSDCESHDKSVIYENYRTPCHWSQTIKKVIIGTFPDCDKCLVISGGSDSGEFVYVNEICNEKIPYLSEYVLENGDILLTIQEQRVSGFTYLDTVNWLKHCVKSSTSLVIASIPRGEFIKTDLF